MRAKPARAKSTAPNLGYTREALHRDATIVAGGNTELGTLTASYLQASRNGEGLQLHYGSGRLC